MRRILALAITLVLCIACTDVFAGGAGNCVRPIKKTTEHIGVGAAFEYNYVDERMNDMENKYGPKSMKVKNVNQVYGKVMLGLGDYVNLYGKIGGSNYDLEFVDKTPDASMVIDLENGIYTGVGVNALFPLMEVKPVSLGIGFDVQGNFFMNDVKGLTRSGQAATKSVSGAFYGLDGQNSLYLTCEYNIDKIKTAVVPYIGGYHSWALVGTSKALSYQTGRAGYVGKKHYQAAFDFLSFGLLLGVDVDIAKYVSLNVEGRLIGETAITTGATIKF